MLWNTGVVALILTAFAFSTLYAVQRNLTHSIDLDMIDAAEHAARDSVGFLSLMGPPPPPRVGSRMGKRREDQRDRDAKKRQSPPRVLKSDGTHVFPWDTYSAWDKDLFRESLEGKKIFTTLESEEPRRIYSMSLVKDNRIIGVVQADHPLTEMRSLLKGLTRTLIMLIPLALLAAAMGGAFLTGRALRPVRDISQAAEEIGAEDLSKRLPTTGGDEFAGLASNFNKMFDRLQFAFQNLESAFERQRRFTADASHELRTPLTTIKANTSLALFGERTPAEYRKALQSADRAADSMNRIVQDLLFLARSDSGQLGLNLYPILVEEVLQRSIGDVSALSSQVPVHLQVADPNLKVAGDFHYLVRLFDNLLTNALRHTTEGSIVVSARQDRSQVVIQVTDTGEGIAPEHLSHLGERFYRVDAARSRSQGGFGLGLAICKSVVQEHGGEMEFESELGKGTTVTVTLPYAAEPEEWEETLVAKPMAEQRA
jgi:heavy metal sensor kinase